jgi:hydroxymethylglutaryl-CoA reductase
MLPENVDTPRGQYLQALIAQQTVSEQMAEIFQSTRDGCATDEDVKRLKILREQYIALSKEVEDVMGRRLARKQPNDT